MEGATDTPQVSVIAPAGPVRGVVLVLHGGGERGLTKVAPWRLAYLRMVPYARALGRAGRRHGIAVWLMRNRVYGWNAPELDPVRDARWALQRIHAEHPGTPVVIVGHSMGGRVALRVADDPAVVGVCALAPWTPPGEPVPDLHGTSVLIVHGDQDRVTNPADSFTYAQLAEASAARLARFELAGEGHAMLRRPRKWTRLVRAFVLNTFGITRANADNEEMSGTFSGEFSGEWTQPSEQRLRIRR